MDLIREAARREAAQRVAGRDGRAPGSQAHAAGALRRDSWEGQVVLIGQMSGTATCCHTERVVGPAPSTTLYGHAKQDRVLSTAEAPRADSHAQSRSSV